MTVTVSLSAIRHNVRTVKDVTGRPVCAVVKADGYGHGQAVIAGLDEADRFAVATTDEAVRLKRITDKPVLILGRSDGGRLPAGVIPSVSDTAEIERLRYDGWRGSVAVKVNSGMNRLGCRPAGAKVLLDKLAVAGMTADSVFTHFHCPADEAITAAQFAAFDDGTRGLDVERHCCASNGLFLPDEYRLDYTRPGIALYGYGAPGLRPAMRVTAPVVCVRLVGKGEYIGYGTYSAPRDMAVATVAAGYADGYRRMTAARVMRIDGRLCPVVGQVCMDMCFADVTDVHCRPGDEAVLLDGGIDLARSYGTIVYEALTGFGQARGQRVYVT